jgi:uncharacterized protein (TIGR02246 family)
MTHIGIPNGMDTEIAAMTERFRAALARRDGTEAAAVYGKDALLLPPAGDVISGREAIEKFWSSGIEVGLRAVEFHAVGRGGAGSVLYEHGGYRMVLVSTPGPPKVERGPYVVVHVQSENGSWSWVVNTFGRSANDAQRDGGER